MGGGYGGVGGAKHRPDAQSGGSTPLTWVHSNYVGLVLDMRQTRDCTEQVVFGGFEAPNPRCA